jgi:CIC family chloride channel protein
MCIDEHGGQWSDAVKGDFLKPGGLALLLGGVAGLVCTAFRLALRQANQLRDWLVPWAQGANLLGLVLLVAGCAAATAIAAWLVRRFAPAASGGGIPNVKAVLPLSYSSFATVPVHLLLGALAGLLGVVYNRAILGTPAATERLRWWPVELRAAVIGGFVGLLAWSGAATR